MASRRLANGDKENNLFGTDATLAAMKCLANTVTTSIPSRNALGSLVNHTDETKASGDAKKAAQKRQKQKENSEPVLANIDLKKVKPRVDTRWRNQPLHKPLTSSVATTVQAKTSSKLVKAHSTETAVLKEVKFVKTDKWKSSETSTATSKRQEINLARNKVRVLTTTSTATTATKTEPTQSVTNLKTLEIQRVASPTIKPSLVEQQYGSHSNNLIRHFNDMGLDQGDEENPLLVSEYVNDIYSYLFDVERKYAIHKNHLDGQREVIPRMRTVLVDWINEVHLEYHLVQETFHMAVALIDRYLQAMKTTSRKNLQLVGVTALFISSKYEELYPPKIKDFVYITDYTYTKDQVLQMEEHILKKLKFELGHPTSIHFLRRFSKAAKSDSEIHVMAKYFIELACVDYKLCEYLPSEIAAASLYTALVVKKGRCVGMNDNDLNALWTVELQNYSTYNLQHLVPALITLIETILTAPISKTNNVYRKYGEKKFNETALIVEHSADVLGQLELFARILIKTDEV